MQAAEMRMMCEKTLCIRIPNGLLKDRTGVEHTYWESCGRDQTEMAWASLKNGWRKLC